MQRGRGVGGLHRLAGNKRCKKNNVEAKKYKRSKDIKKYVRLSKNLNLKKIFKILFLNIVIVLLLFFSFCDS